MKKIWVVILSIYVTLITVACVFFAVLYFGLKLGWNTDVFGLSKAECVEVVDATHKVMTFENSHTLATELTDSDYEKKFGQEAEAYVAVFRRMIDLTKGILENDEYVLTNNIITFHVDGMLSSRMSAKMQMKNKGEKLYISFCMTAEGEASSIVGFQYLTFEIDYDFQNHKVRTYTSKRYEKNAEDEISVDSCKYSEADGTSVLKKNANDLESFKSQIRSEAEQFDKAKCENTDYDFSKEFKEAQQDLLGN